MLLLRPSKPGDVLILRRAVVSVSDWKARSRIAPVFLALDPAPPGVRQTRPPRQSAEELDILWPEHSAVSRTLSRSVVTDFCFGGNTFCRRAGTFLFTASWNDGFCYFI